VTYARFHIFDISSCFTVIWVIWLYILISVVDYYILHLQTCYFSVIFQLLQFIILSFTVIWVSDIAYSFIQYLYDSVVAWLHCLYARALLLLTYTHRVTSNDSGIVRADIECIHVIVQVFDELAHFMRSLEFSSIDSGILISLTFLYSCDYSLIYVYQT